MVGGAASCGITHTAVVPLDLVKESGYDVIDGFKILTKFDVIFYLNFRRLKSTPVKFTVNFLI